MVVNQTWRQRHAMRIDNAVGPFGIEVFFRAPGCDFAVDGDDAIAIEDRFLHLACQNLTDVLDDKLFPFEPS